MGSNHPVDNSESISDETWWAAVLQEADAADVRCGPPPEGGGVRRGGPGEANGVDDWELARRLCASEEVVELEVVGL